MALFDISPESVSMAFAVSSPVSATPRELGSNLISREVDEAKDSDFTTIFLFFFRVVNFALASELFNFFDCLFFTAVEELSAGASSTAAVEVSSLTGEQSTSSIDVILVAEIAAEKDFSGFEVAAFVSFLEVGSAGRSSGFSSREVSVMGVWGEHLEADKAVSGRDVSFEEVSTLLGPVDLLLPRSDLL